MARPLRIWQADGWYHVTSRGNERQRIFRAARDYRHFEKCLAEVVERFRLVVQAYVLMPNHYHLMVQTGVKKQQASYRAYVEEAIRSGLPENPWEELKFQMVLGSEQFAEQVRKTVKGNRREQPSLRRMERRPSLGQIIAAVETVKGQRWPAFRDRYGDSGRDLVLYLAGIDGGMKLSDLGKAVGNLDYVTVSMAVRRCAQRLAIDAELRRLVFKAREHLGNRE